MCSLTALSGFHAAELAPLGDGQIRRFVTRWYRQSADMKKVDPDKAEGYAARLQQAIFARPQLTDLARRPLLLTLMASLHAWRGGELPKRREQLYGETVDLLLDRWEKGRYASDGRGGYRQIQPSLQEYLDTGRDRIRRELERLAFEAHRRQGSEQETADIPEAALEDGLQRCAGRRDVRPLVLVDYLRERSGLLIYRGGGVYRFPHRSFQEYLAARWLAGHGYPGKLADLALADPDRWREVVLLTAARISDGGEMDYAVWSLVSALSRPKAQASRLSHRDAWGTYLGAQVLVELVAPERLAELSGRLGGNGSDEEQGRVLARVCKRLAALLPGTQLPARERAAAGDLLAVLGDPRFDAGCWGLPRDEGLGFVRVEGGEFVLGTDDPGDGRGFGQRYPDARPAHPYRLPAYWIGRWPVTVDQFRAFVSASGHRPSYPDSLDGPGTRPVMWVDWPDVAAYCRWLDGRLGELATERLRQDSDDPMWRGLADGSLHAALPSEPEWELAARGREGRVWPFAGELDAEKANYRETGIGHPSCVGCFLLGVSPYGVEEMAGNVWEWTRSLAGDYPYPRSGEPREAVDADGPRVLRGGSFIGLPWLLRAAVRYHFDPLVRGGGRGFRVVLSPLPLASGPSGR